MKTGAGLVCMLVAVLMTPAASYAVFPLSACWDTDTGAVKLYNGSCSARATAMPWPARSSRYAVVSRSRNLHPYPDRNYPPARRCGTSPAHGLRLTSLHGDTLTAMLAVRHIDNMLGGDDVAMLMLRLVRPGREPVTESLTLGKKALRRMGAETILRLSSQGGTLTAEVGAPQLTVVWRADGISFTVDSLSYLLAPGAAVELCGGTAICYPEPDNATADVDSLRQAVRYSSDMLEGEWLYLDRTADESLLRPGGTYRLLISKDREDAYNMYYIDGASVRRGWWRPGMLKGRMESMGNGRFRLLWRDAAGDWMASGLTAALEQEDVISLIFPYQSATVRFSRVNAGE